jgi:hypothetical protein
VTIPVPAGHQSRVTGRAVVTVTCAAAGTGMVTVRRSPEEHLHHVVHFVRSRAVEGNPQPGRLRRRLVHDGLRDPGGEPEPAQHRGRYVLVDPIGRVPVVVVHRRWPADQLNVLSSGQEVDAPCLYGGVVAVDGLLALVAGEHAVVCQQLEGGVEFGLAVEQSELVGDRVVGGGQAMFAAT